MTLGRYVNEEDPVLRNLQLRFLRLCAIWSFIREGGWKRLGLPGQRPRLLSQGRQIFGENPAPGVFVATSDSLLE